MRIGDVSPTFCAKPVRPLETLPFFEQCLAVEFRTAKVDAVDPPCISDVIEWICVEHDEVCALAGRESARVGKPHYLGTSRCCRNDRLRWREPELHPSANFVVFRRAECMS